MATTISIPSTSLVTVASTTSFPTTTLGTDGYKLFDVNGSTATANATSLPTYVNSISVNSAWAPYSTSSMSGAGPYSAIDLKGASDTTGVYYSSLGNGATAVCVTISLSTTSVPSEFQLGILDDNSNQNDKTSYIIADVTAGVTSATLTDSAGSSSKQVNDFYLVDISGAQPNDVITISAIQQNTANAIVGGVTFDTLVPEPASLSLLGAAALLPLLRRRRTSFDLMERGSR